MATTGEMTAWTSAAVAAITVGSGSGHTAQPVALAAQTETFPPVNLGEYPTLQGVRR